MSDDVATVECTHLVAGAVSGTETLLGECVGLPLWSLSDKDIDGLVPRAYGLLGRVMGSLVLPLVREADRRGLAAAFDAPNTAGWVKDLLQVTFAEARRMVQLAKAVDGDLAATGQALAEGRISAEHAQVIARAVADLPDEAAPWVPQAAERTLLEQAELYDPRVLGKIGREILAVVDPDHGDELLGRQLERENRAAEEGRQLNARRCGGSRVRVTGWFDAEGWQTVSAALDPLAAPRPADADGQPDERSYTRRQADALVELADRSLRVGDLPEQGGDRQPLDVGRASRTVPGPLRRAVVLRDGGCTFPSCDVPPKWCDVHHAEHWADGGPTSLPNLLLVCPAHHYTAHHSDWEVRIAPDGLPEWIPPLRIDFQRRPRRHHRHQRPPAPPPPE